MHLTLTDIVFSGSMLFIFILSFKLLFWMTEVHKLSAAIKDIPCVKPHWLLGHLDWFTPDEAGIFRTIELINQFPKCTIQWFGRFMFYFFAYHPDILKPILNCNAPKDDAIYRYMRPWIGDGLLTSSGKKWKRNRQLLTPAFHFDILKKYLECMNDTATEMINKWSERTAANDRFVQVEMFHDVSLMALDNLLQCILSKKTHCQRGGNLDYLKNVKLLTETALKRLFNPFFQSDFIFFHSKTGRNYKEACENAKKYTEDIIDKRKSNMVQNFNSNFKLDFLDILLLSKDENGIGLTHQEICDEVNTFVFEGHDTVTSAISWTFYNLASFPQQQEICRKEVFKTLENRKRVDYEDLAKFEYLTMCIKESMRLYPPVLAIGKQLDKPLFCPKFFGLDKIITKNNLTLPRQQSYSSKVLPKNIKIAVGVLATHRNPFLWECPNVFQPTRFTPDNNSKRPPHSYIPFSTGPRNCIGQNFAMNQMKVVLALALQNFRFTVDKSFPEVELEPHIILRSRTGIHLNLHKL